MKVAAAYIRVSTDDQIEYSPDSQKKAILDYAKHNGYIVPEEFIYADEGISGRSVKRPEFQKMIGTAKQKPRKFEAILVWKFSRFARNREDSIVYKSMLRKQCGIDVVSISEQLGEDKTSILIEALLEAMDEYYSINLAEEVVRGMSEKARRGGAMGSAAYGYIISGGVLVPDAERAPIVQRVFAEFCSGEPIRRIASRLNADGIRTRMGGTWDNRGLEYLLKNVTYTGVMHWTPGGTDKKQYTNKIADNTIFSAWRHEAIIDKAQFDAAQERLAEVRKKYAKYAHRSVGTMFALKGLVRCSNCGATLIMSVAKKALQCRKYARGQCNVSHNIRYDYITALVIDKLKHDIASNDFGTILQKSAAKASTDDAAVKKQIARANIKLERIKDAYQAGIDTLDEYRANKAAILAEIGELKSKIESKPDAPEDTADVLRKVITSGIAVVESDAPEELKNDVLSSFIDKIIFTRSSKSVSISYYV